MFKFKRIMIMIAIIVMGIVTLTGCNSESRIEKKAVQLEEQLMIEVEEEMKLIEEEAEYKREELEEYLADIEDDIKKIKSNKKFKEKEELELEIEQKETKLNIVREEIDLLLVEQGRLKEDEDTILEIKAIIADKEQRLENWFMQGEAWKVAREREVNELKELLSGERDVVYLEVSSGFLRTEMKEFTLNSTEEDRAKIEEELNKLEKDLTERNKEVNEVQDKLDIVNLALREVNEELEAIEEIKRRAEESLEELSIGSINKIKKDKQREVKRKVEEQREEGFDRLEEKEERSKEKNKIQNFLKGLF